MRPTAGVALNFQLGERVRVTSRHVPPNTFGRLIELSIDRHAETPGAIDATVVLERAIISKGFEHDGKTFPDTEIWTQCVPVTELEPAQHTADLLELLERAESFITGFEDDEAQEGVRELLADMRAVLPRSGA
jgi:hypothetical protein